MVMVSRVDGITIREVVISDPIGNECWLRGIDVTCQAQGFVSNRCAIYNIYYGTDGNSTYNQVRDEWRKVIDVKDTIAKTFMTIQSDQPHQHFSMNKHFDGNGLRFAVTVENNWLPNPCSVQFAFEISEG